jgi:hypothetical protein
VGDGSVRCGCGKACAPTGENIVGIALYEGYSYLIQFNCECGSTKSAVMWESEESALDVAALEIAAE